MKQELPTFLKSRMKVIHEYMECINPVGRLDVPNKPSAREY